MVRVLVAAVILWSVLMSLAQQDDQIVSKDFPANITCQRNRAQRNIERQQALAIGGSENLLVILYCILYACNFKLVMVGYIHIKG